MSKCRSGNAQPRPNASNPTVPNGSAVPADSPLARAREAAKRKAEDAEKKNAAAAVEVKNVYRDKVNELREEKARQAAEADAVRRNQENIRQQMEAERPNRPIIPPPELFSWNREQEYCWRSYDICMSAWNRKRDVILSMADYDLRVQNHPCTGNGPILSCFRGPKNLDFNR
jgi:hypothetical protein